MRVLRYLAWREPLPWADKLDLDHNGAVDEADVTAMIQATVGDLMARAPQRALRIESSDSAVTLRFPDDSWLTVPRNFNGTQTGIELSLDGEIAPTVASRSRTFHVVRLSPEPAACVPAGEWCSTGRSISPKHT